MYSSRTIALASSIVLAPIAGAQGVSHTQRMPGPAVVAIRHAGAISLDGRLDEPDWSRAAPAMDFRQRDPLEGLPATQRTEVRFLYDDDALYVGARMYDTRGARGVETRLGRRDDEPNADYFMLVFDTYHDHAGRTVLRVDPSGVQYDALALGNADPDPNWDAVWDVATRIDSLGWTAELRIPFAELRLAHSGPQTWGLQLWRYEQRLNETSQWAFWPKVDAGGPPSFGHLVGLAPDRALAESVLPYVAMGVVPAVPSAASSVATRANSRAGVDVLVRSPGASGTMTVNPDFGQVEVDPAVLNLTAHETFFPEKRPFFVQDAGVFSYGGISCFVCTRAEGLQLYYSRRVGHPPSLTPSEHVIDEPAQTPISAAGRITVQSSRGWIFGALAGGTAPVNATVADSVGFEHSLPVEPRSVYVVSRAEQRATSGDGSLGVIGTLVDRGIRGASDTALAAMLPARALTGGVDLDRWWRAHSYHLTASTAWSSVTGDSLALHRIQSSSVHYFQRPGRHTTSGLFNTRFDTSRRSLDGYAGAARFARDAGHWTWELAGEVVSPGFEANDFGFAPIAGVQSVVANLRHSFTVPTSWYHASDVTIGVEGEHNFDGDPIARAYHVAADVTLPNYATVSAVARHLPARYDDALLRGGPTVAVASGDSVEMDFASDLRGAVSEALRVWDAADRSGNRDIGVAPSVAIHPTDAIAISAALHAQRLRLASQLMATVIDTARTTFGGRRYMVGSLDQRLSYLDLRVSAAVTRSVSVDVYAQPFATAGAYANIGEFAAPRSPRRLVYGRDVGTVMATSVGGRAAWRVVPDSNGTAPAFVVLDPSGTRTSLRGTAVLRWEYRAGSTIYLAWTHTRSATFADPSMRILDDAHALRGAWPSNAVLVKVTYRLAR